MHKRLLLLLVCSILLASCGNTHKEVVATWPDGSPQMVNIMKGKKDKAVKVGERRYYQNGTLQFEKHFSGTEVIPDGKWTYYYPSGKTFATADFTQNHQLGEDWTVFDTNGNNYFNHQYDSVRVVEMGEYDTPASIIYFDSCDRYLFQFFSNGSLRCTGMTHEGLREGRWTFYHPTGLPQVESNFIAGQLNGIYTCYRENGVPYYRGIYINGLRTGVWEFYDENANLVQSKDYDKE